MSDALKLHSQPLWDVLAVISLLTKCLSHELVAECLFLSVLLYWYAVYLARYWKRQQQMDGLVCGRVLSTCFCWHLIMIRSKCVYLSASKGKKARGMKKEMMLTSMGRTRRKIQKVQWSANQSQMLACSYDSIYDRTLSLYSPGINMHAGRSDHKTTALSKRLKPCQMHWGCLWSNCFGHIQKCSGPYAVWPKHGLYKGPIIQLSWCPLHVMKHLRVNSIILECKIGKSNNW